MDEWVAPACVEPAPSRPEVDVFTLAGAHHTRALRQVCEAAMGELEGDGFLGALLGWTPRGDVVTAMVAGGPSRELSVPRRVSRRLGEEPLPFQSWQPDLPDPHERERAVTIELRARLQHPHDRAIFNDELGRHGLLDHARKLVYDGRRFLGVFSIERALDRNPYVRDDLARLDEVVRCWLPTLAGAAALDEGLVGASCALLFDARGRDLHTSPAARRWRTGDRVRRLADAVRTLDAGRGATVLHVGSTEARLARLERAGATRYLVTLRPTAAPLIHPAADLSPRQRQVAAFAAAGATAKEIGETLGISSHTVRRHLRVAHRVLGTRNRVELARALAESSLALGS